MPRRVLALVERNAVAAASALVAWLLIDLVYVSGRFTNPAPWTVATYVLVAGVFVSFCVATWRSSTGTGLARTLQAVALAGVLSFLWFVCAAMIVYWFHFAIGGTE